MSEDIKEAKQLLIENNLSYAGQLSFLAYTTRLEEENQQLKSDLLKEEISYNNLRESYNLECDRNKKLVSRIENDEEDIRHLLDIINHNCNELKCNSDEWLVLKGWQDRLKEVNNE